jgi:hypothetical protein
MEKKNKEKNARREGGRKVANCLKEAEKWKEVYLGG